MLKIIQHYFSKMQIEDIDEIVAIEKIAYKFPWTSHNFISSIEAGHSCICLRDWNEGLLGYFLMMSVVDEAHLLNMCINPSYQGCGFGSIMLNEIIRLVNEDGMKGVLLEVRPSNIRAFHIYKRFGFIEIGRRKNYYSSDNSREDAIVMRFAWEGCCALA
ncbi:ribosomal protein S18-alanine N-acetyltransferase [Candidatus Pandoraea novymonadis]|uniref:[Ribosomal protein bS18]-alanine N-acetyltransferase n=1 Tax=Candidatus Pandoraea novymonadis TaxID=1808959 RepID=A0ABX5FFL7_9BURK|nr:ribosomal protein S18-alanine N-acetyltransferase [Candidatus Pandoraea novymonadis]PSB92052.1 hypothetical protein BZL35_00278 [Candidatus Pandoraea novymonadis]